MEIKITSQRKMSELDNIELRSEKVRNIIGQIPPKIIRIGITIIFFIIAGMLTGTYFFKYEYTIKTTATIEQQGNSTIIEISIPANEIGKVKQGQKVILNFNNVPNLYNEQIKTEIQTIPKKIEISKNEGYYLAVIKLSGKIKTERDKALDILGRITINVEIITDKISFFDRMIAPFKDLISRKG